MKLLFLLLFLLGCTHYGEHSECDGRIDFKEDSSECIPIGDPRYLPADSQRQQGSGLGMSPHMRLSPNDRGGGGGGVTGSGGGGGTVTLPDLPPPFQPPPLNNGENGVPIVIAPDDPGGTPTPGVWKCTITFINQTLAEKDKYNAVCGMLRTIVPSLSFKNKVLGHVSYSGSVGYYGSNTTCDSAGELGNVGPTVYQHILNGDERRPATTAIDNELDIKIEMYRDDASNTVGYTYTNSDQIWVNRKYSDGYKPASLGSNMFHEWLHKMSYGHSSASTSCRPYSIPYAIGYIARDFMVPLQGSYGY